MLILQSRRDFVGVAGRLSVPGGLPSTRASSVCPIPRMRPTAPTGPTRPTAACPQPPATATASHARTYTSARLTRETRTKSEISDTTPRARTHEQSPKTQKKAKRRRLLDILRTAPPISMGCHILLRSVTSTGGGCLLRKGCKTLQNVASAAPQPRASQKPT